MILKSLCVILAMFFSLATYSHVEERTLGDFTTDLKQDLSVEINVSPMSVKSTVKLLKKSQIDVTYANINTGLIHILINQDQFEELKSSFPQLTIKSSKYVSVGPAQEYKTYDEIVQIISGLKNQYPNLIHVTKIGTSLEGREILAVRISNDKEFNIDEPSVLFNALHHAREVMTVEIIQDILESLMKGYATDTNMKAWVDKLQIWLIPMVNPDGSNRVWTGDAMWRKNTRDDVGVDINRNYPFKWGACNGSSSSRSAQDYRGASPASEPETQTMMSFIEKTKPLYSISYHSYGEMVIHPFGCNGQLPAPADQVVETAKQLGALVKHKVGASWQILYDVDGGDIDWLYGVHHVIPFVLEVSTSGDGFQPSYNRRDPVVQQNKIGWQYLLAKASGVGLQSILNINNQQTRPTNVRWGGKWYEQSKNYFKMSRRTFVFAPHSFHRAQIFKNVDSNRMIKLAEHFIIPAKDTHHYQLSPGRYTILVMNNVGKIEDRREFEVKANSSIMNQVKF